MDDPVCRQLRGITEQINKFRESLASPSRFYSSIADSPQRSAPSWSSGQQSNGAATQASLAQSTAGKAEQKLQNPRRRHRNPSKAKRHNGGGKEQQKTATVYIYEKGSSSTKSGRILKRQSPVSPSRAILFPESDSDFSLSDDFEISSSLRDRKRGSRQLSASRNQINHRQGLASRNVSTSSHRHICGKESGRPRKPVFPSPDMSTSELLFSSSDDDFLLDDDEEDFDILGLNEEEEEEEIIPKHRHQCHKHHHHHNVSKPKINYVDIPAKNERLPYDRPTNVSTHIPASKPSKFVSTMRMSPEKSNTRHNSSKVPQQPITMRSIDTHRSHASKQQPQPALRSHNSQNVSNRRTHNKTSSPEKKLNVYSVFLSESGENTPVKEKSPKQSPRIESRQISISDSEETNDIKRRINQIKSQLDFSDEETSPKSHHSRTSTKSAHHSRHTPQEHRHSRSSHHTIPQHGPKDDTQAATRDIPQQKQEQKKQSPADNEIQQQSINYGLSDEMSGSMPPPSPVQIDEPTTAKLKKNLSDSDDDIMPVFVKPIPDKCELKSINQILGQRESDDSSDAAVESDVNNIMQSIDQIESDDTGDDEEQEKLAQQKFSQMKIIGLNPITSRSISQDSENDSDKEFQLLLKEKLSQNQQENSLFEEEESIPTKQTGDDSFDEEELSFEKPPNIHGQFFIEEEEEEEDFPALNIPQKSNQNNSNKTFPIEEEEEEEDFDDLGANDPEAIKRRLEKIIANDDDLFAEEDEEEDENPNVGKK